MNRTAEEWKELTGKCSIVPSEQVEGLPDCPWLTDAIEDIDEQAAIVDRQSRLIATLTEREDKMRAELDLYRRYYDSHENVLLHRIGKAAGISQPTSGVALLEEEYRADAAVRAMRERGKGDGVR